MAVDVAAHTVSDAVEVMPRMTRPCCSASSEILYFSHRVSLSFPIRRKAPADVPQNMLPGLEASTQMMSLEVDSASSEKRMMAHRSVCRS